LGGENRYACGSAVKLFTAAKPSALAGLGFLLTTFGLACSRQAASLPPDPATLLRAIPAADSTKYPALGQSKHWANPYLDLVIRPQAVALLTSVTANEEQILKPEEVLPALARVPAAAWPYGRVVAVLAEEKPNSSEQDKIAIRRSRGIVEGDLRSAQVEIYWMPEPK
jgi:hypothetical protein